MHQEGQGQFGCAQLSLTCNLFNLQPVNITLFCLETRTGLHSIEAICKDRYAPAWHNCDGKTSTVTGSVHD